MTHSNLFLVFLDFTKKLLYYKMSICNGLDGDSIIG